MKRCIICLVLLTGILTVSCTDDKCVCPQITIHGSGNTTTTSRTLSTFTGVALNAAGEVHISPGATQSVSLTVDDNILQYITTTVQDRGLRIGIDPTVNIANYTLRAEITTTALEALVINGSGTITGQDQFNVQALSMVINGSGTITIDANAEAVTSVIFGSGTYNLSGLTTEHATIINGSGAVHAFDLAAESCVAAIIGSGLIEVTVSDSLEATVNGSGAIYYQGNPGNTDITVTGGGTVQDVG
jgi:hypothetical protein